jgi:hypothetical protein
MCLSRAVIAVLLFSAASGAWAQETPKPPEPTPEQIAAAEAKPGTLREQTIYIPYAKLKSIFEKEGRGVFIPYDKFQELWKAAREAGRKMEDVQPPVPALIAEIESTATVGRDVMNVQAKLAIEVLAEGWHEIPLRLTDAAIRSATIGGAPARVVFSPEQGYRVLVEKKGKEPEKIELVLEYSKAFSKSPGTNTVEFDAPQAPVNRWQIKIAEAGVKVNVHPNLAASDALAEMGAEPQPDEEGPAKETVVQAFVGAADKVRIDWTAKAEGAAGLAALATVQARQEVVIDEGVIRTRANLTYEITRADVTQLVVEVPADHNVVNIFDPNVQKWEKQAGEELQTITITLFQPTRGTQNIALELEKIAGDKEMPQEMMTGELKAPMIRATQVGTPMQMTAVGRQQGVVAVRLGSSLRAEVTSRTGLLQVDNADLPAPLAGQEWTYSYRYSALPFDLAISVEKLQPLVEVEELVETYIEPNQITTNLLAVLNIQRAGIFQAILEVPDGYEVRAVQGRDAAGAAAVAVDSHRLEEVEITPDPTMPMNKVKVKTKLVVSFGRKAMGKVALWIELQKRQDDPNLLSPTDAASSLSLPHPRVNPTTVARTAGRMIVHAPESLRITPKDAKGLRTISAGEALQNMESTRAGRFPTLAQIVAYAYSQEPASLTVEAQRRKPYIEARQLLAVNVESGVIRYDAWFFYDIKFSSVKSLRIDVPQGISGKFKNLTTGTMHETLVAPAPADVPAGYVAWSFAGDGELLGSQTIHLSWESPQKDLPVGQQVAIELPHLRPHGVDRAWGQIAASKSETIEISVDGELTGLRPIDPQRDLMPGAPVAGAARAFEFYDDWSLPLVATRYELEEVKRTSIERGFVRMVVTRSGEVDVNAIYRLRSARQRIAIRLPGVDMTKPSQFLDTQPLKINNQPAPLEKDPNYFYIPLTGHSPDRDVLVEIHYTVKGTQAQLDLPDFSGDPTTAIDDPAVQQVHLAVYLPPEQTFLGVRGPWTDETSVTFIDRTWRPDARSDEDLLSQIRSGIDNCSAAGSSFPTDGRRYLFSTLRPEPEPAGSLRLTTAHQHAVNFGIFAVVAIMGLGLAARPIGVRLWWLAGLVVLIVLAAVFAPALATALLGDALKWALILVLLVWLVRFLAWALPQWTARLTNWLNTRPARAAAAAAVVAAAATTGTTPFAEGTPPPPDTGTSQTSSGTEGGESHG